MRILVIDTTRFRCNGIVKVIMNYYRAIDKSDIQMDFVVINEPGDSFRQEFEANGSKLFVLESRSKSTHTYYKELKKIIEDNHYDIIHAHGNSATLAVEMLAAKKCGVKVRIAHSHNTTSGHMLVHRVLKIPFFMSYTNGFACGEDAGRWLFGNRKFEVINNGINEEEFRYNQQTRDEIRSQLGIADNILIGHVGLFSYQKYHEYLINMFSKIIAIDDRYRLILIGDGELKEQTIKQINELKLNDKVICTGQVSNVNDYMQAMDVFTLTSRFEGLPLVLVEAQASGLRCVVSDVITREANIVGRVEYAALDDDYSDFVNKIMSEDNFNRANNCELVLDKIRNNGYSITGNADRMKKLYEEYITATE